MGGLVLSYKNMADIFVVSTIVNILRGTAVTVTI